MEQKDWDELKDQMGLPWGTMHLQCDGFKLTLQQEVSSKSRSFYTAAYVDGYIEGVWFEADESGNPKHEEARRFWRRRTRSIHSAKTIAGFRKDFGKKEADALAAKRVVMFDPSWKSFSALKKHLLENNTSITRLPE